MDDPAKVDISGPAARGGKWVTGIKAKAAGSAKVLKLTAKDAAGNVRTPKEVEVHVGQFVNTPEFPTDLIAKVFREGKADQMQGVIRMLHNHPQTVANQKSAHNVARWKTDRACGTVAKVAGQKFFNIRTDYEDAKKTGGSIHKPILKKGAPARIDISYVDGIIERMAKLIQKDLKAGMPVLVSVVDDPPTTTLDNGMLNHTSFGAHSVLIVACTDDHQQFLFLDPWPSGSKYKYAGGISGATTFGIECKHLGVFKIMPAPEPERNFNIMMNRPDSQGTHTGDNYLEVIFGPLR